jgi:hypothetical protein
MTPRFRLLVLAVATLGVLDVAVARADPLTVTSGQLIVRWDDPSGFAFFGPDGFELNALFIRVPTSAQQSCFDGCAPGTLVNLSATAGGGAPLSLGLSTAATVNGVTLARPDQPDSFLNLAGTLHFDAPDVALPGSSTSNRIGVSAPFVFQGTVAGFARDDISGAAPLFQLVLTGRGTATLNLVRTADGVFRFPEVVYDIGSTAATPEPAVAILFGLGIAAAFGIYGGHGRRGRLSHW